MTKLATLDKVLAEAKKRMDEKFEDYDIATVVLQETCEQLSAKYYPEEIERNRRVKLFVDTIEIDSEIAFNMKLKPQTISPSTSTYKTEYTSSKYLPSTTLAENTFPLFTEDDWIEIAVANSDVYEYYYSYALSKLAYDELKGAVDELATNKVEEIPQVNMAGHLYPCNLVIGWINKLRNYNAQLTTYMQLLEKLEQKLEEDIQAISNQIQQEMTNIQGEVDSNIDGSEQKIKINAKRANKNWIASACSGFCRTINWMLEWLRYSIIKALHGLYKACMHLLEMFNPLVDAPTNPIAGVKYLGTLVEIFWHPYWIIITFIKDFFKYTPKLFAEFGKAVTNTARVAPHTSRMLSKLQKALIKESQAGKIAAEKAAKKATRKLGSKITKKSDTKDTAKEINSLRKKLGIHFKSITLADIISGKVDKPKPLKLFRKGE